jgi:hypothetical protein
MQDGRTFKVVDLPNPVTGYFNEDLQSYLDDLNEADIVLIPSDELVGHFGQRLPAERFLVPTLDYVRGSDRFEAIDTIQTGLGSCVHIQETHAFEEPFSDTVTLTSALSTGAAALWPKREKRLPKVDLCEETRVDFLEVSLFTRPAAKKSTAAAHRRLHCRRGGCRIARGKPSVGSQSRRQVGARRPPA